MSRISAILEGLNEAGKEATPIVYVYYQPDDYEGTLKISDVKRDVKRSGFSVAKTEKKEDSSGNIYYVFAIRVKDEEELNKVNRFVNAKKDVCDCGFSRPSYRASCSDKTKITMDELPNDM